MRSMNIYGVIIVFFLLSSNILTIYDQNSYQPSVSIQGLSDRPRASGNNTILINEYLPNPASDWDGDLTNSSTGDEWVELYNYGPTPVNISGWYINDSVAKKYTFPIGIEIQSGNFYVVFGSNQSLGLNNGGDSIILYNSTGYLIDSHSYGSSLIDTSMGRIPDGATNWTEFTDPTPGQTNGQLPKIVINEFMPDPEGADAENEWIELFNNESKTIDLADWVLTDQDGEVDYIFDTMDFPPQNFLIICTGYGNDDLDFSDNVAHLYMSKTSAMLNNDGDDILLTERNGLVIDYIAYGRSTAIDPPLSGLSDWDGVWYDHNTMNYTSGLPNPIANYSSSIKRIQNGQDMNTVLDWGNASDVGITPGWNNNDVFGFGLSVENSIIYIKTSEQAEFNFSISNIGYKDLDLIFNTSEPDLGWSAELNHSTVYLAKQNSVNISLIVTAPDELSMGNVLVLNVSVTAVNLIINLTKSLYFTTIIPAVELSVSDFSLDGGTGVDSISEGELIYLKVKVSNTGQIVGGPFSVGFFYNQTGIEHLIGEVNYDYIYTTSNKYPAVYWDTLGLHENITLTVKVDYKNDIVEPDENNNMIKYVITIQATSPNQTEKQLLITELYYDTTIPYEPDEYVKIANPTNITIDISGWQLTDDPAKDLEDTVSIPDNTWLLPGQEIFLTNHAQSFLIGFGFDPDLACDISGLENVLAFENSLEWPGFSNSGDLVVLRNNYRHIIDLICYGQEDSTKYPDHWSGPSLKTVPEGKILKRQRQAPELKYFDTNTASDWEATRLYAPGQSDLYVQTFEFQGEVIPFANPENGFKTIMNQFEAVNNYIYLNVYEFTHPLLAAKLIEALHRNVTVRLLLEGNPVGWNFSNAADLEVIKVEEYTQKYILTQLYGSGAEIKFLSNIKNDKKSSSLNKRYKYNHAKYAILDGKKTLVMSGNMKPTSLSADPSFGNREWGISINDPGVAKYFEEVFFSDWTAYSEYQNDTHPYDPSSMVYGPPPDFFSAQFQFENSSNSYQPLDDLVEQELGEVIIGEFVVEPVLSPDTSTKAQSGILGMINNAEDSVYIQQMECNLDWRYIYKSTNDLIINWTDPENQYLNWLDGNLYHNQYLAASIEAARRGCDVKILLDSRYVEFDNGPGNVQADSETDNLDVVQYINNLANLEGLTNNLEARLAYLSGLEKIHNKGVIVDGESVLISSINWNHNSVANNRETGVIVKNSQTADFYSELFEYDWTRSISINKPAQPNSSEHSILITEVYPDTYLNRDADEYIAIHNPSGEYVDVSGWAITDKLTSYGGYEGVLLFPKGTKIRPKGNLYIARLAGSFFDEFGILPDFEFLNDSLPNVPQMEIIDPSTGSSANRGIQLANKGDEIVLADEYLFFDTGSELEHIIDMVVYGNSTYITNFPIIVYPFNTTLYWSGPAVYNVSEGEILKRNQDEDLHERTHLQKILSYIDFIDTDSAVDWENYHVYHPGQSNLKFYPVNYTGSVTLFSSPDSSFEIITSELEKAKESIYLSIYQFHHLFLMDKLMNASRRGVDVKVFIDGGPVGGLTDLARYVAMNLVEAGCEVSFIRSVPVGNIHRRYNYVHTKYAVIDNYTVIVLSENWKTSGVPVVNSAGNRGWGVVLRNSKTAHYFGQVFFSDWNLLMKDIYAFNSIDQKYGNPPEDFLPSWSVFGGGYKPRFQSKTVNGDFRITPVIAPDTTLDTYGSILELIGSAKESVYIEQLDCYINWNTKGREIENLYLQAAIDAARRGCEVKILLDSTFVFPDNPALDNYDTIKYINKLAKIENLTDKLQAKLIYPDGSEGKNQLSILHNKGIIVDGEKTLVSSINWATGSVIYNREAGVIIENPSVARFFTDLFNYDWNLTVQELVEVFVLHSDTRELAPGDSTVFTISILNTQPYSQNISLSLTDFEWIWEIDLQTTKLHLPAGNINNVMPIEIKLTVTAPSKDQIMNLTKNKSDTISGENNNLVLTLELGVVLETSNMSACVYYITTHVKDQSTIDEDGDNKPDGMLDRSLVDPWLVIILLAAMLIMGAVARDIISSKLSKKKKRRKIDETGQSDIDDTNVFDEE